MANLVASFRQNHFTVQSRGRSQLKPPKLNSPKRKFKTIRQSFDPPKLPAIRYLRTWGLPQLLSQLYHYHYTITITTVTITIVYYYHLRKSTGRGLMILRADWGSSSPCRDRFPFLYSLSLVHLNRIISVSTALPVVGKHKHVT